MARRGGVALGRSCPQCGADEWIRRGGTSVRPTRCGPCQRRAERAHRAEHPELVLFRQARKRAEARGEPFAITPGDVLAAWPRDGRCPALGIALSHGRGAMHDASPTLDRLNGEWGYEPGNIAVISLRANRAKANLTAEELERLAAWMRSRGLT